ncbi:lipoprotein-associated protein [Mycoplasma testudineum]|uniref:Lipoprotein-associated protein n=1 Tax=Mycoplasma testudineum TaxID=244584 RepID=A0A4R6IAB4_9MOLU|nr:lipoprotein 17-related variable surface protein [Mycoplasma testudineum]OYD26519.1 hypothetical protein CG473_03315 [Mycoplasma testudineum]TDO19143.1 lipoprotein-associated protein [Mycoplasma testudineum]
MKKRKLLFGLGIPVVTGLAAIVAVACNPGTGNSADEEFKKVVDAISGKSFEVKDTMSVASFGTKITGLTTKDTAGKTSDIKALFAADFSTALGSSAQVQSATFTSADSKLKLSLSYPNTDANMEATFTVSKLTATETVDLESIFTKLNDKTFAPETEHAQKSPQMWETWAKGLNNGNLTTGMKAWISGNFDTDLGAATITKVAVTAPANDEVTTIIMTLTLSNGTANKDVKITVSPLPSKKSLDSKTTPENKNQLDVTAVKTALEKISTRTTVNHKNDLPAATNNYNDAAKFLADINQSNLDLRSTNLTFSNFKNDTNAGTKSFTITIAKTGATSIALNFTVSGFKTNAQGAQADVNTVKNSLEAISKKTTVNHKNDLPIAGNNYADAAAFLADINQSKLDLKETTLTLSNFKDDPNFGIKSFTITISKTGATSATVTFAVSGFKTTAQGAQADINAVKAALEAITPKTTVGHKNELPTTENDYKTVDELLTDLNQNTFDSKQTTLALGKITNDEAAGTKTVTITISKKDAATTTTTITIIGFNTTAKVAQNEVDAVKSNLEKITSKVTKSHASKLPSAVTNYENSKAFLDDISQSSFNVNGSVLSLSSFTNNDKEGSKTFTVTITKNGTTATSSVTVTGFNTTVKVAQAEVDHVEKFLKALGNDKTTLKINLYPDTNNDYSESGKFFEDISVTAYDLKGTKLSFNKFNNNVATGIKTFEIVISKESATNKTVPFTVKGFKIADSKAKAWYDKWSAVTNFAVKQYDANTSQLAFTRGTAHQKWNTTEGSVADKFNAILATKLNEESTPTLLTDYSPVFEIQPKIDTNAESTTLKLEYYLTKVVNDITTYFNADGTEADALEKITKSSLNLSGMVSDINQLKAQEKNMLTATTNSGLYGTPRGLKLAEWKAKFKTINLNTDDPWRVVHRELAPSLFSEQDGVVNNLDNPQTGENARGIPTALTLFSSNVVGDDDKIKKFMARLETKTQLLNRYKSTLLQVFSITLTLNGTSYDAVIGALNGSVADSVTPLNDEVIKTWFLNPSRDSLQNRQENPIPYENQTE